MRGGRGTSNFCDKSFILHHADSIQQRRNRENVPLVCAFAPSYGQRTLRAQHFNNNTQNTPRGGITKMIPARFFYSTASSVVIKTVITPHFCMNARQTYLLPWHVTHAEKTRRVSYSQTTGKRNAYFGVRG